MAGVAGLRWCMRRAIQFCLSGLGVSGGGVT